jgi:hypothetical protein
MVALACFQFLWTARWSGDICLFRFIIFDLLWFLTLSSHFWPFAGVLQGIPCEVTRKVWIRSQKEMKGTKIISS